MGRIVHFEINADNPERTVKFYGKVFGWKIGKWGQVDYWLASTGDENEPGINGAIQKRTGKETTCIFVDVPSVDEYLKKIVQAGGKAVTEKMTILGVGYSAYCKDTEGNVFGIFQSVPSAK